jgi:hypothetical protein
VGVSGRGGAQRRRLDPVQLNSAMRQTKEQQKEQTKTELGGHSGRIVSLKLPHGRRLQHHA